MEKGRKEANLLDTAFVLNVVLVKFTGETGFSIFILQMRKWCNKEIN